MQPFFNGSNSQTSDRGALPVRTKLTWPIDVTTLDTPPPATIAASGIWNSGAIPTDGFNSYAAGCTLSQAGTLTLQRFLDAAATIPVGAAVVATLVAATPNTVSVNDGLACASMTIAVHNTSGSTGNLTAVATTQMAT